MIGVASGPTTPNPCGIPGCMATLRKVTVPSPWSTSLTTSFGPPMLTPPLVTSRSACGSWRSMISSSRRGSSGATGDRQARQPACRAAAASMKLLDSQIFPGVSGEPGSASSFPVEITTTRGRGRTTAVAPAGRRDQAELGGPERCPRAQQHLASPRVVTGQADRVAGLRGLADRHLRVAVVGPLHRDHRIGAGGQLSPRHDPNGRARD